MDVLEVVSQARDSVTAKRVFGEPYEKNGTTIIPAARVAGAGGGGGGQGPEGIGEGNGTGFGIGGHPVGAFVVREDKVFWVPAVDIPRVLAGTFLLLLGVRAVLKVVFGRRTCERAQEAG